MDLKVSEFTSAPNPRTARWPIRPTAGSVDRLIDFLALAVLAFLLTRLPLGWAGLAVSALIIGLLMFRYPALGLAGLALAIPFGSLVPLPVPGVSLVDALVALSVAMWLAQGLLKHSIVLEPPRLTWPLFAFIWVAGWSLTGAFSWGEGVPELLKWLEFAAVYWAAAHALTPASRRWVIGALLAAGTTQAVIGAYQFFQQAGPEPFIVLGRFLRAYGTFRQPNPYAGYLGYLFPIAFSLTLGAAWQWWGERQRSLFWMAIFCAISAGALGAGILMSWSRGAWLGLAAATVTVVGLRSRRAAIWATIIIAVLVLISALFGIGWLPEAVESRLTDLGGYVGGPDPVRTEITDANFSVLERLAHWRAGLAMFSDHPWLGVGIGNFAVNYVRYASPHWYEPLGHAHNVFINFLAETGALGAGAFGIFWLGVAWLGWRAAGQRRGLEKALAIGVLGTWMHLTVHSMFDNLFVHHMQLQLALLLGVVVTSEK